MAMQLYVAVPTSDFPDGRPGDHPFTGYFLPYPEKDWGKRGEGLVSTIMDEPPQLNWIYVDRYTHEIKYGDRAASRDHIVGPWDVTKSDRRLTLEGWEGFMAVRYGPGEWALYFDRDDDRLDQILPGDEFKKLEVSLVRREIKQRPRKLEIRSGKNEADNNKEGDKKK